MNILLLTPLYKIEGRETLERNTEAIHHLVKYWVKEDDINLYVINTYLNPGRNIKFLFNKVELSNYKKEYDYEVDNVKVLLTEVQQIPFQRKFWRFQNKKMLRAVRCVVEEKNFKPDLVIAHFPVRYLGIMETICPGVPKVAVLHFTDIRICKKFPKYIKIINKQFYRVYSRSESIKREANAIGIEHLAAQVINSGVPFAENISDTGKQFKGEKRILYVGKLIERKHPEYIVRALGRLKEQRKFQLTIIGKGPFKEVLQSEVRKADIEDYVKWIDAVPREQVYEYMNASDVFIMPSVQETLGLVYLEAMMHGCITVGTEGEGIDGIIVNGENGYLVKPLDPESVYQCLNRIFSASTNELMTMSRKAIESGHYYNEEDMALNYLNEMKTVVKEVQK